MKKKREKRKGVQGGGGSLYRLLDMHERFQKVLEDSEKLQCMRDSMCDKAGLGLGLGSGSRFGSKLGLGLGLVLGS